jgi:hypothetical protein
MNWVACVVTCDSSSASTWGTQLTLASFIDLHKKKGARNRQRQHRTKTGKSEGFNDSQENQIWLNTMLNETDDLLVLHGLLGSDRKIAAERTHQNLS